SDAILLLNLVMAVFWASSMELAKLDHAALDSCSAPAGEQEPVSKLCDELGLQPTVLYRWQKEFFENGRAAFPHKSKPNHQVGQEHRCSVCGDSSSAANKPL